MITIISIGILLSFNVLFVFLDISSVGLVKFGLKAPFKRLFRLTPRKILRRVHSRLGTENLFELFFAINSPECRKRKEEITRFYVLYSQEDHIREAEVD